MQTQRQTAPAHAYGTAAKRPCVLLVSDSASWRQTFRATLGAAQIEIREASSLQEAGLACGSEVDLAVVDISMDDFLAVLELLRTQAACADMPILVDTVWLPAEPQLALNGALPRYRAMPCTQAVLLRLVQEYLYPEAKQNKSDAML